MISTYIGSGDTSSLLAGFNTLAYKKLWQRFVSDERPHYNSYNSPIDALRTGKILEERYFQILPEDYYQQTKAECKELDVLISSIDFAKLEAGKIIDFDELKTCEFNDFIEIQKNASVDYIVKNYSANYKQVQFQLLCTGLESANMVFLCVYSYDDEVNYNREIHENEIVRFRIYRNEEIISQIKDRAKIFQDVKNNFNQK